MSKVAIVGVEGSGKTVLMAALGEMYGRASQDSLYLMPENQAAFSFMTRIPHKMRVEHQWPEATAIESMKYLKWTVRFGTEVLTELEMLDYPGELYRMAFGDRKEAEIEGNKEQIHEFLEHLVTADFLIVLMNLKDAMDIGANARNNETVWLTRGIFDYAKKLPNIKNRLLVFTQADRYRDLLGGEDGAKAAQEKHLPMLSILHSDLECISISAVEAPESNAPDAEPTVDGGLHEMMGRIVTASEAGQRAHVMMEKCQLAAKEATCESNSIDELDGRLAQYEKALNEIGGAEAGIISAMYPGTLDEHGERFRLLDEFSVDVHKVINANSPVDLAGDQIWLPLIEKYDGLSGQLASIQNIKSSYSRKNVNRTANILFVGFLLVILAAAIIGIRHYLRSKAIDKLSQTTALPWDISKQAILGNADAQYEVGNALLSKKPTKDAASAVEWLVKSAAHGNDLAQSKLCEFYYIPPISLDNMLHPLNEMPRNDYLLPPMPPPPNPQPIVEIPQDDGTSQLINKYAEQGAPWSQNLLGEIYYGGLGVSKDDDKALLWFRKAAEGGNIYGMLNIGNMYLRGEGTDKDDKAALSWLRRSAEMGLSKAQAQLGEMCRKGIGVEKNIIEAKKWLQKAADQGNAEAQAKLGFLYDNPGDPSDKDNIIAVKWFRQAAEQGDMEAQYHLGLMYEWGRGVKKDGEEATSWYRKAFEQGQKRAEQGDLVAQKMLGEMYLPSGAPLPGRGVERDYYEAVRWCRMAADRGDAEAQYRLGELHYFASMGWAGHDVPKEDESESLRWYQLAAEQGHLEAQKTLGNHYSFLVKLVSRDGATNYYQNMEEAAKWYQKAADQGDADAQFQLGCLYRNGDLNPNKSQDYETAAEWFRLAAAQGHTGAQENMGVLYYGGFEVRQDYAEALKWFQRAAENSSFVAKWMLARLRLKGQALPQDYAMGIRMQRELYDNKWDQWGGVRNDTRDSRIWEHYPEELGLKLDLWKYKDLYAGMGQQGNVDAQWLMGELLFQGREVPSNDNSMRRVKYVDQDEAEAAKWFLAAAGRGDIAAQRQLASMYYNGNGVAKSYQEAFNWCMKSAVRGDADAQYAIAEMYQKGEAISPNPQEAFKWYQKAAVGGNDDAQYIMGESYRFGRGVKQDMKAAESWYRKAAEKGNAEAKLALKEMGLT